MNETEKIAMAILGAARLDVTEDIPKYDARNSGDALLRRLYIQRAFPRRGDARELRRLYTAFRFLIETEVDNRTGATSSRLTIETTNRKERYG